MTASSVSSGAGVVRWWRVVTILLAGAVFTQAIFAGAILSGEAWAHAAHSMTAIALVAATTVAGLVSLVTLRRVSSGTKLGLTLLALAAALLLQMALGKWSADGANLMWVHVPLGVALVGLAAQAVTVASHLGARNA